MGANIGIVQVLKRSNQINELLGKGYTKTYIYNLLIEEGKLTISRKRFYQLLKGLNMNNAVLYDLPFPMLGVQTNSANREHVGGEKETENNQVKTTAVGNTPHKKFFPKQPELESSFKRQNLPREELI